MALRSVFLALVLATYPAQALDLKKELERLRGGADDKGTRATCTTATTIPTPFGQSLSFRPTTTEIGDNLASHVPPD